MQDASQYFERENAELRQEVGDLKFKMIQASIEKEMSIIQPERDIGEESPDRAEEIANLKAQILDLQIDLDNQRFRTTILEAEKLAKTLDLKDLDTLA
jgi:hypothetical protein